MSHFFECSVTAGLLASVLAAICTSQAKSQDKLPDLTISTDSRYKCYETKSNSGYNSKLNSIACQVAETSCEDSEPLWKGVLAIKNEGSATAQITRNTTRTLLRVYALNNAKFEGTEGIDLDFNALNVLDQRGIEVEIGRNISGKACERFDLPPPIGVSSNSAKLGSNAERRIIIRKIQSALRNLPSGVGNNIKVDGIFGPNTRTAFWNYLNENELASSIPSGAAYEFNPNNKSTYVSDTALSFIAEQLDLSPYDLSGIGACQNAPRFVGPRTITLIAEVNPYHSIKESDYSNNRHRFNIEVICK